MSDIGMIPVDWEARFDPQRMLRERLQRAKEALMKSDLDALFIFCTKDARFTAHPSRKTSIEFYEKPTA